MSGPNPPPASDRFPSFRYYPEPAMNGSFAPRPVDCRSCGQRRDWTYSGPVYAIERLHDQLCPWCVADGSAAVKFDAVFTDVGYGTPDDVPQEVRSEIATKTPGFSGWQQERWLFHCGDAAAFLGHAGYAEIKNLPDALEMIRMEHVGTGWSDEEIDSYVRNLRIDGDATAYLFQCLHCDAYLAYSDFG